MAEFKGGSKACRNQLARRKPAPLGAQPLVGGTNDRAVSGKAGALGGSLMSCRHGPALRMRHALLGTTSIAALGLALAMAGPSFAEDWTGITSTDWFTAGNWSSGVPTSSDNAIIDTVTPNATVIGAVGAQAQILRVGSSGTGTLTIQNGGGVTSLNGLIGADSGSTGTVTVDGAGSIWNSGSLLEVGRSGTGTLTIQNGGAVTNTIGSIGENFGSAGTVTVDGTGATWTNSSTFSVGRSGTGTLTIQNGGTVSNLNGYIGTNSTGTVTVDGVGSTWTNSSYLSVGHNGTGMLTIQNGGAVSNTDALIGVNSAALPKAGQDVGSVSPSSPPVRLLGGVNTRRQLGRPSCRTPSWSGPKGRLRPEAKPWPRP
jgi:T5SS/PEP-CTERM-associated repeat protein